MALILLASLRGDPLSTGQPLVVTFSPAQQQEELGVAIMTMYGHPPVQNVLSRDYQLEQQVKSTEQPSTQETMAPTPAQPPEEERVGVMTLLSLLWVSSSYKNKTESLKLHLLIAK